MKQIHADLLTAIRGGNHFLACDLVTLVLRDGTTLRWTTAKQAITIGAETWVVGGPRVSRPTVRQSNKFEVGQLELTIRLGTTPALPTGDLLGSILLAHAATHGAFDGASVKVARYFADTAWTVPIGTPLVRFAGNVAGVDVQPGSALRLTVKSELEKLVQAVPQAVYSPLCTYQIFDAGCGVIRAAFTSTGAAAASSTASRIYWASAAAAFRYGWIKFTSGVNNESRRSISGGVVGSYLDLSIPLPAAPTVGDTFQVLKGCNKLPPTDTANTCQAVFSNGSRFRGFPSMPTRDAAT